MYKKLPKMEMPNGEFIEQSSVRRLQDGAIVPFNEELSDYHDYLAWLAEGNEPLPADESQE